MKHLKIQICYNPQTTPPFQYTDEQGNPASVKKHCLSGHGITWSIKSGCTGVSNVTINFPSGNPFTPSQPNPVVGTEYFFNTNHLKKYKYTVSLLYNGERKTDDPQIEFDDGTDDDDLVRVLRLDDDTLAKLGKAAESAFDGLRSKLEDTAKLKRDPTAFFFPGGINNIQVTVNVPLGLSSLNVSLGISGPDGSQATSSGNSPVSKKRGNTRNP